MHVMHALWLFAVFQCHLECRVTQKLMHVACHAAGYMRRNKMTVGDVIAITRRPDGQLVCTLTVPTS